ncbi:MAG: hypothetical protein WCS99_03890 [Limisphaerales bacterium]
MNCQLRSVALALALGCGAACGTTRTQLSAPAVGRDSVEPHDLDARFARASRVGEWGSTESHPTDKPGGDSKSPARNFQKWNPIWWFGNVDDPEPPDWYRPGSPCRRPLWQLRNPLHNFTFYVIGIADRPFTRTGRFPDAVFAPDGGWNWAVAGCKWVRLPFISYNGEWWRFYLGWRERGNFGGKVNVGKLPAPDLKPQMPDPITK